MSSNINLVTIEKEIGAKTKPENEAPMLQVRSTKEIKLKDKVGRQSIHFRFLHDFGFIPEEIIISKVSGRSNCIQVHALLTTEELQREAKAKKEKELQEQIKKTTVPEKTKHEETK